MGKETEVWGRLSNFPIDHTASEWKPMFIPLTIKY